MSSTEGERPQLDPLAFPSDTTFRFVLLVLAVLGTSLFAFQQLYLTRHDVNGVLRANRSCILQSHDAAEARRCSDPLNHAIGAWTFEGVCVVLAVALVVYLAMPHWKRRRRRLEPLTAEDAPEVVAQLAGLAAEAGLATAPRFVWNPLNRTAGGLAFGRVGRRYVALGGGLVTTFYTDPEAFRAVVLHELGHVRNRDVDKAYFTMALWYSFLGVAVLPLLISLHDEHPRYVWSIVWRLAALVALVYLSRNAVLRAREVYADVRAAQSAGSADALRRVIGGLPATARRRWRRLLSVHPEPPARVAVLDDTDLLFRPGVGEALLAGIVLTLNYGQLQLLFHYYDSSLTGPYWYAALAVAPFCAGVVALGIWRAAFLSLARRARGSGVWRVGAALGIGFLAGEVLSLQTIVTSGDSSLPSGGVPELQGVVSSAMFGPGVLWAVLALAGLTLFALWLDAAAAIWLSRGGERAPRYAMTAAIVVGGAVLTVMAGLFFLIHDTAFPALPQETAAVKDIYVQVGDAIWVGPYFLFLFVWDGIGQVLGSEWPVIPAFALLWAFPLAAAASRGRGGWPGWAFRGAARPPGPRPERLTVSRAVAVGLAAGLAAWGGALALRAGIRATEGVKPPLSSEVFFGVRHWQFVMAVAAQGLAAVVAVLLCRRRAVLHGLAAGFVAGLVAYAGLMINRTIASCVTPFALLSPIDCPTFADADSLHTYFDQTLAPGSLVALAASLATAAIGALVRRLRDTDAVEPAHVPG
jgi:Zn-dependent protease with chaperone function